MCRCSMAGAAELSGAEQRALRRAVQEGRRAVREGNAASALRCDCCGAPASAAGVSAADTSSVQPVRALGGPKRVLGVGLSAGEGRGRGRAALDGAVDAGSRDCTGDARWMLKRAGRRCVDAWTSTSMTSSPKLQVPQQSLAAYTGRAEPYRQTWGRVASNTKSRILNPTSQSALPADCAVPALALHAISAPPLTCDTLLAVHLLLPATAISFNSLALISCIAPLIAQAQDPEVCLTKCTVLPRTLRLAPV
jgi:hypothetical protein